MSDPVRLTVVMTHPVQYYSPWFRYIAAECPALSLTVVYAIVPTPEQQGTGFGESFNWDTSLMSGYESTIAREANADDNIAAANFFGLNVGEIRKAVLDSKPQVVLVPGWNSITLVRAAVACRRHGIPVLYRGDSQLGASGSLVSFIRDQRARMMLGLFSRFLAVGERSREYLEHFGVSGERVFFSPHCVDNEHFARIAKPYQSPGERTRARIENGIPENEFVVLYLGKLEQKKRPIDAIRAVAALGDNVTLLMVGSGELESECRAAAQRLGAQCVFTGFKNQTELGAQYGIADCLVLPSDHRETWGLVVNEAMAAGLPCVVSDAAGCSPDMIVEGKTGYSYPLADIDSLSRAIASVRSAVRNGVSFSDDCRDHVSRYSYPVATEGLLAACSSVTRQGERKRTSHSRPMFESAETTEKLS